MELAYILIPIFAFVLIKNVLEQRGQARTEHLKLLEEALKNPAVDRQTLETLTFQLTGKRSVRPASNWFLAFVLAIGWISLFVGAALWVVGGLQNHDELILAGVVAAIAGFGFVTYPFALRELDARRQA